MASSAFSPFPPPRGFGHAEIIPPAEEVGEMIRKWTKTGDNEENKLIFYLATPDHIAALKKVPVRLAYFGVDQSGLLFVRKVGPEPDRVHRDIAHRLNTLQSQMGLERVFWDASCTRIRTRSASSSECKVCDASLSDYPPFRARTFPTLVVEAGYDTASEPLRSIKDWWFSNTPSGTGVNIVLLVRVVLASRELQLELWYRDGVVPASIVTVFPTAALVPDWVATGRMIIPFESVALRSKKEHESDFVLGQLALASVAASVFLDTAV